MKQRGFTLVEILMYVAIASLLLGALGSLVVLSFEARARGHVTNEVEQQAAFIFHTIDRIADDSIAIVSPVESASGNVLELNVQNAANDPTRFELDGTTLEITRGASATEPLHNDQVQVSNFVVNNLSRSGTDGVFQIELTLTYVNEGVRTEFTYAKAYQGSWSVRP